LINDLWKINQMYYYSLKAFITVFQRAMAAAPAAEELAERVENLVKNVTFRVYSYTRRGLFERHKLIFATLLCLRILGKRGEVRSCPLSSSFQRSNHCDPAFVSVCAVFWLCSWCPRKSTFCSRASVCRSTAATRSPSLCRTRAGRPSTR
jgi:hypothetical protein